jgi:hypothetical protein
MSNKHDWKCPACLASNWGRKFKCFECHAPKPTELLKGDWFCSACNFYQFARNKKCMTCKKPKAVLKVKEGKECIVCMVNARDCIVMHGETGHYIMCMTCATKVNKCPICRQVITHRIRHED